MSDPSRSPVAPGDIVGGKYRVERVIGAGGMGVVVAATHLELGQSVALKFLLPHAVSGPENIERFVREARAAVRLKSDHVARVYDVGRDADRPYMVLELLEGLDLAKHTKKNGSPSVADACEYVLQACEALVEAHGLGIVHRDLKPQNLFVTKRFNGEPLVKVLDFGISKAIGPAAVGQLVLTDSSAIMGSPLYMAPEQMRAARLADVRSDVWALGVILYELLAGKVPFDGETVTEVCLRVVNEPARALAELRPTLDPRLVATVMRCLAKDPDDRVQNCARLAEWLEPFARSSQTGAPARAWRSVDDTQDPRSFATADDTGPSTAVTLDDSKQMPKVSTGVAWGQATPPPSKRAEKNAAFGRGLAVGAVATVAAAAMAAMFAFQAASRRQEPSTATSAPPPPSSVVVEPPPAPTPQAPPPATTTASAPAIAASALPSVRKKPPVTVSVTPTASATARPTAPPAAEPTAAPNGAPILR